MTARKITVEIEISKLVPVTSNDGGYLGRSCMLCGISGWDGGSPIGFRSDMPDVVNGKRFVGMRHAKSCPLNEFIDGNTGRILEAPPAKEK